MIKSRRVLCGVYAFIALLALVATWRQNLAFMTPAQDPIAAPVNGFAQFWLATLTNHATTSIMVDLALLVLAAVIWMVIEARRVGVRFVWAYVVLAMLVAVSVTFPLFLIAREMRIAALPAANFGAGHAALGLKTRDWIGITVFGVPTVVFAFWTLVF